MTRTLASQRGLSLAEVTVMVTALSVMGETAFDGDGTTAGGDDIVAVIAGGR